MRLPPRDTRTDTLCPYTALLRAVVAAMRDPFEAVDGKGVERLRAAGVQVQSGLMEAQARALNRGFLSRIGRGRPWLRIKLGSSLDGRTAMANGDSKDRKSTRLNSSH